jgi:hypothetical protein
LVLTSGGSGRGAPPVLIVGVVFGALHLVTNQLATGWFVLIVPVSAVILQTFPIRVHQSGPLALIGQPGFIEGGLVAGFVTALLAVALLARHRPRHPWTARMPDDAPDSP